MLAAARTAWDRVFMLMLIAALLTQDIYAKPSEFCEGDTAQVAACLADEAARQAGDAAAARGSAEWDRAPIVTLPTTGQARLDTLPSGSSPCERIRRVMTDLPAWSARDAAAETGTRRVAAINDVSTTMKDLAADDFGRSLADSLGQTADLMSRDIERRDEMREELKVLTVELMLAALSVCRSD
mgnify:CR=1 FL=1